MPEDLISIILYLSSFNELGVKKRLKNKTTRNIKEENKIIGFIKIFFSDLPEVPSIISSLSLRSLFRLNRIDKNIHIGKVKRIIFGNRRITYEI
jgi:hypothetical protein